MKSFLILFNVILLSLSFITFRLSNSLLPFATEIFNFAIPFLLRNREVATTVIPTSINCFSIFFNSCLFKSNFLLLFGSFRGSVSLLFEAGVCWLEIVFLVRTYLLVVVWFFLLLAFVCVFSTVWIIRHVFFQDLFLTKFLLYFYIYWIIKMFSAF